MGIFKGLKAPKRKKFSGSFAWLTLLRGLVIVTAIGVCALLFKIKTIHPLAANFNEGVLHVDLNLEKFPSGVLKSVSNLVFPLLGKLGVLPCVENDNLTINVFQRIIDQGLLVAGAKALCVGEGSDSAVSTLRELGFSRALGVEKHPFFYPFKKAFVYELNYIDNSFDFVFSRALDRISVPALLVLEMERVLRPGGTGAMLVGSRGLYSGGLIRSATPVSAFLKSSTIVLIDGIGTFTLVIFKKGLVDRISSFEHLRLPDLCPSITNNKPFLKYLEPLGTENEALIKKDISYLPKFRNISSPGHLIYINIGAGKYVNSSIANWLKPYYNLRPRASNIYIVDHDTSALSYVKEPGTTFVYHPDLFGVNLVGGQDPPLFNLGFDFNIWFEETVGIGNFVVLAMNAGEVELKLLLGLFESGGICHVDELFLHCSGRVCLDLFIGLRNRGLFVHQWWRD